MQGKRLDEPSSKLRETVRKSLAQDFHDDLGQYLASISLVAKTLRQKLWARSMPEAADAQVIATVVQQAMNRTRDLCKGVRPVKQVPNGLMMALEELAHNVETTFNITCLCKVESRVSMADFEDAADLYYIVQQAVSNAIKHGRARCITIELNQAEHQAILTITDDGVGFSEAVDEEDGIGLEIMKYRAKKIGAELVLQEGSEGGTKVTCTFRYDNLAETKSNGLLKEASRGEAKAKVLIVDDHPITRQGLVEVINREDNLTICGEAKDGAEAMEAIAMLQPDCLIVDLAIENVGGLELIKSIKKYFRKLPVLVLTSQDELLYAERAIRAGALGYIMKREPVEEIMKALNQIIQGLVYVGPSIEKKIMQKLIWQADEHPVQDIDRLTDRELEVLKLIGRGFATTKIAGTLHLSAKTIETYRGTIKKKLFLNNANELLQYAVQRNLI